MKFKNIYFVLFFFLSFFISIFSYSQHFNFRNYSIKDGLAQSVVFDIFQDSRGYIWFATDGGGISVYDGKKFINYNDSDGLPVNRITSVVEDKNGNMWLATDGEGIVRFDGKNFKCFNEKNGLISNKVRTLALDYYKNLWVGTEKGPVKIILDDESNPKSFKNYKNITKYRVYKIFNYKNELWFCTEKDGLVKLNIIDKVKKIDFTKVSGNNLVRTASIDINDDIWVGTPTGLYKCSKSNKNSYDYDLISKFIDKDNVYSNQMILSSKIDSKNALWIGTYGGGVYRLKNNKFEKFSQKEGLSKDYILCIYEDNSKNLWLGTYAGGAIKFTGEVFTYFSEQNGLPNNIVFSITQDNSKNIWLASYGGGVSMYDGENIKNYTTKDGLYDNQCFSILKDSENRILVGTLLGLNVISTKNNSVIIKKIKKNINPDIISALFQDNFNNIWIGTYKNGLYKINIKDLENPDVDFANYSNEYGLDGTVIYSIIQDKNNDIWIATYGKGVYCIKGNSLNNSKLNYFVLNNSNGLSHNRVISIAEDRYGNMWFGTAGGGICKYDHKSIKQYGTKNNLLSNNVYLMYFDKNNNLWAGYEKGLDKIVLNTQYKNNEQINDIKEIKHYGINEGFRGYECNSNSVFEDVNGKIWFGTVDGINIYNPKEDFVDNIDPKIHITDIKLFYRDVDWTVYSNKFTKWFNLPENLKLPYDKNNITFEFIGINMKVPENVKYKYILRGLDDSYSPETKANQANYTNIPPGEYVFEVIASNSDGFWNEDPIKYEFTIDSPFWLKWWFVTFEIGLVIAIIMLLINRRERKLINERNLLQEKVEIRTIELQKKNENIATQNIKIQEQNYLLEKRNELITDSIDYAKRIQSAILSYKDDLISYFPNSFIINKPKDIVSGDFFWYYKHNSNIYFAVNDCTGHGVPGALMSIVANSLFEQTAKEKGIIETSKILDNVNALLKAKLKNKKNEEVSIKDGIAVSLCRYDEINNILYFSGSNHDLYLLRNKELIVYKGDKIPIDANNDTSYELFSFQEIKLEKNDQIILFTDGYIDQKGGEENKKYYSKYFKQLLVENCEFDLKTQKNKIVQSFFDWKGDNEQIDDILIVSIKF